MKFKHKYILYLGSLLLLLIIVLPFFNTGEDWTITFFKEDKNPFGGYVLHDIIDNSDLFENYTFSNQTIYELSETSQQSILILCESFDPGADDLKAIKAMLDDGRDIMIMAHHYGWQVQDSFNISIDNHDIQIVKESLLGDDSVAIQLQNPTVPIKEDIYYPSGMVSYHFWTVDTARTALIATNNYGEPVVIRQKTNGGRLILGTVPLVFTNFGLLYKDNFDFAEVLLSYLNKQAIHVTNYYQFGRLESQSPLRYILSVPSWRMAVYVLLIFAIVFIVFESKRRHKPIPVLTPLRNHTLDFVWTIGSMYYQKGDHRDLAAKKWRYFQHFLKAHYYIDEEDLIIENLDDLVSKLGRSEQEIREMIKWKTKVDSNGRFSSGELNTFINIIDQFYK